MVTVNNPHGLDARLCPGTLPRRHGDGILQL